MDFDLPQSIAVLERTPRVLRAMLDGLPDAWLTGDEGPGTWTPADIVRHLVSGEETDWMVRARIILARGADRRFTPFDRTGYLTAHRDRPLAFDLARFESLRHDNLAALRSMHIGPAELALTGEHPEFGSVTLAQLLATWVVHDLGHLAQIARVMAKQYREAIGPWTAYLPVVTR